MFLWAVAKYVRLTWEIKKIIILSEMEYRIAFLTQVILGGAATAAYVYVWVLFFQRVSSVSSWNLTDSLVLMAIAWHAESLLGIFCAGIYKIARMVTMGRLEYFILMPHNILWHIAVSRTSVHSIGEIPIGWCMFYLAGYTTVHAWVLFFIFSVVSAGIIANMVILVQSISFFISQFESPAYRFMSAFHTMIYYPNSVFKGWLKALTYTIFPVFFVGTIPARLLISFDMWLFVYMVLFWIITGIIAVSVFHRGLKRYESGSLIQVNL